MERYRVVGGVARLGLGTVVGLTNDQLAPRRHLVDIVESLDDGAVVRLRQPLDFKVGETIDMAEEPEKRLAGILEADDGAPARRPRKSRASRARASAPAQPAGEREGEGAAGGGT